MKVMQKGEESVGDLAEWRQRKEVKRVEIMEQGNLLNRCHNLAQTISGIEESDDAFLIFVHHFHSTRMRVL